jgi:Domain of unknown function (DUF5348)
MSETSEMRISMVDGAYTLRDEKGVDVVTLTVGERFEVQLRGVWCQVRLESGGYMGRYYVTADGERGRLAVSMQARPCEHVSAQLHVEEPMAASLEQARATWVGKEVESRIPLAGGLVHGVVREITEQGQMVVIYTPPLNGVPVVVTFPVERVREVLTEACAAA